MSIHLNHFRFNAMRAAYRILLFLIGWIVASNGYAQTKDKNTSLRDMYDHFDDSMDQLPALRNDSAMRILSNLQGKSFQLEGLKSILANRLDTSDMRENIPRYLGITAMLKDNIAFNKNKMNLRYLLGLETEVNAMLASCEKYYAELKISADRLQNIQNSIALLHPDSTILYLSDSNQAMTSIKNEAWKLKQELASFDKQYKEQSLQVAKYMASVQSLRIRLLEIKNIIFQQVKSVTSSFWTKEINAVWEPVSYEQGSGLDKIQASLSLTYKIVSTFILKNSNRVFWLFGCIALVYLFFHFYIPYQLKKSNRSRVVNNRTHYFHRYPMVASILLISPFAYLFFNYMPLGFIAIITFLMVCCIFPFASIRFSKEINRALWLGLPLYVTLSIIRLNWDTVYELRWIVLLCNLAGLALGWYIWAQIRKEKNQDHSPLRYVVLFLSLFLMATSALSAVGNILGLYRLSKIYATAGVVGFYRGIAYSFFITIAMEAFYLLIEGSKASQQKATSTDVYETLVKNLRKGLGLLAVLAWIYFTLFYLGLSDVVMKTIDSFLNTNRKVGDVEFRFGSVLLFFFILFVSAFLANTIAYFTSIRDEEKSFDRKHRIGTSVLLIRIAILTAGFLLALAATNIPIDRITIVLGALSVGIGFGLQNIIENLVSGLILAFEKPIQVGDQIEVGDKDGVVREVGIRSSVLQRSDGSDLIVPNGSLISQGLVNWTLTNNHRRIDLIVLVANDSDAAKASEILTRILDQREIASTPPPKVLYHNFSNNAIELKVQFWVMDINEASAIKSKVMGEIIEQFKLEDIKFAKKD